MQIFYAADLQALLIAHICIWLAGVAIFAQM